MPVRKIDIKTFVGMAERFPILDARSPGEFANAHIPGAISLPLFTDEERKIVGTAYKQQGRETAIKIGLDFFGPKMKKMVEEVEAMLKEWPVETGSAPCRSMLVHCWRGGMRSAAIAWLMDIYGFTVYQLEGGYKSFRQHVLEIFAEPVHYSIVGGYTGSGKTAILHEMCKRTIAVIDLEGIANHKGSAFGTVGPQPSQEMFENLLAQDLLKSHSLYTSSAVQTIWLEDESQRIGSVNIPKALWEQMRQAPVYFVEISFDQRLALILKEYSLSTREDIAAAIRRIQKRLGGLETKNALRLLEQGDLVGCFSILLSYYDRLYLKNYLARSSGSLKTKTIRCENTDARENISSIVKAFENEQAALKIET